jgi:hypothetical protein
MKRHLGAVWVWALASALLVLAGCASSTIASRKERDLPAYEALTPEMRALVDQGRIRAGMNTNAVYIAWGRPDQVTEGLDSSELTTTWSYYGAYLQDVQVWGWRRVYDSSYSVSYIRGSVQFTNNIVKSWQTFPAPGY